LRIARRLASATSAIIGLVNASELFEGLAAVPGSKDAGATNGVAATRLINGVEYARVKVVDERQMRAAWKRRRGGGAVPLLLVTDDPENEGHVRVLGPQPEGPVRRIRTDSLFDLILRTSGLGRLEAVRRVAQEVERLDTEGGAGLTVRGLGSEHLYRVRLPHSERWDSMRELARGLPSGGWREALGGLGYELERLPKRGYLATHAGRPVIVVHPRQSADQFARLDEAGRLPEGALVADCLAHGVRYGVLAAGTRIRLLRAGSDAAGSTTRYLELDPASIEPEYQPLVGLLAPAYLADGGLDELLVEARDYGSALRQRLDRSVRQNVLPILGRELGRWAITDGRDVTDDRVRADLEAAALTWVFRALFLLYGKRGLSTDVEPHIRRAELHADRGARSGRARRGRFSRPDVLARHSCACRSDAHGPERLGCVVLQQAGEHSDQRLALSRGERGEEPVLNLGQYLVELQKPFRAGWGDRDDVSAPVVRIGGALDEPLVGQLAERLGDIAAIHVGAASERCLACGPELL
jgi:hypothetical protein